MVILALVLFVTILGALGLSIQRSPVLGRIAGRVMLRAPLRSILLISGLMLATMLVTAVVVVNDTLGYAVESVAVGTVGRVDETIHGGSGPLGVFPASISASLRSGLTQRHAPVVEVAGGLLIAGVLAVDENAQQAHGDLNVLGLDTQAAGPLTTVQTPAGDLKLAQVAADEVYLNTTAMNDLHTVRGDRISLYAPVWAGIRYQFTVRALIDAGPLGQQPTIFVNLARLQTMAGAPHMINRIYIANRPTNAADQFSTVAASQTIAQLTRPLLPTGLRISLVKRDAVKFALGAQATFQSVLVLYALFALAIEVLVIVLLFSLVATEQRVMLATLRSLGQQRTQIAQLLLFQGAGYALAAAVPGALAGIAMGALLVAIIGPTSAHFGFPLQLTLDPQHLLITLCLGCLMTIAATAGAAWPVSRLTIGAALRGLPEPEQVDITILPTDHRHSRLNLPIVRHIRTAAWLDLIRQATSSGIVPLGIGVLLLFSVHLRPDGLLLSLALIGIITGLGLLLMPRLRAFFWRRIPDKDAVLPTERLRHASHRSVRVSLLFMGAAIVLFWGLPVDVLAPVGIKRFSGGIEVFFLAGLMLLGGTLLALMPNFDALLQPIKQASLRLRRLRQITYLAIAYPARQRLRSGLSLALFGLVCFTMCVMASIATATTQRYGDVTALASGYSVLGRPLYTPIAGGVAAVLATIRQRAPTSARQITALSTATPLPLGVIQPGATNAGWRLYPTAVIDGAFLDGVGLPLVARAPGYANDAAVWHALRDAPGNVVIDSGALSAADSEALGVAIPPPVTIINYAAGPIAAALLGPSTLEAALNRPDTQALLRQTPPEVGVLLRDPVQLRTYTLGLQPILDSTGQLRPTTLWITDFRGGGAIPVHVIGIVDNAQGQRYGLLGSPQTFAPIETNLPAVSNAYYYFKLQNETQTTAIARAIGAALLDHGFETTVIQATLRDVNAPRIFASQVLLGLVGLMLFVGTAALMVTNLRNVVERRQQIGMLRALGMQRDQVVMLFILESLGIALIGAAMGEGLGLLLCRNAFSRTFFDQSHVSLTFVVPWLALAIITAAASFAAVVAALIPAWQASNIAPAEALRYE